MQIKIKQITPMLLVIILSAFGLAVTQAQDTDVVNTTITLDGDNIMVDGEGATVKGSTVTITATGTYSLSGTLNNGQVAVESEGAVTLLLNGVDIRNSTSAGINIINAEAATIVLADNSENSVSDGETYTYANPDDDEPNAAVFSDDELTITGNGLLTVKANFNDGISSKDGLTIESGTINVTSVDDGIRGKNYLHIVSGDFAIISEGDALKSDNEDDPALGYITIDNGSFNLSAGGDAIQAETNLTISDGQFGIVSGGGSSAPISEDLSAKGIKAGAALLINSGVYLLNSADDGLHSNVSLMINGGSFTIATGDDAVHADASIDINGGDINILDSYEGIESAAITINGGTIHLISSDDGINAASDDISDLYIHINGGQVVVNATGDGLDSNGSIEMTGGVVIVHGPTENFNAALDFDDQFTITGGFLVAAGSARMSQVPGETSSQNALLLNFDTQQAAGTLVHIQNSARQDILTFAPQKAYQSLAFSSANLTMGGSYQVYLGGNSDGTVTDGLYAGGSYTPGAEYTNFTLENVMTQIGSRPSRR